MKKISLAIMVLVVTLASCKKTPEVNLKYVDVERDLITVGTTTATVQCDYEYIATLKKAYLYYGEGEDETNMNTAEMRVVQNTLYVDLAGLKSNTTYSYFYEFHNGFNSMRTVVKTFKTEPGNGGGDEPPTPPEIMLPTVVTAMVTEITINSAQCGGEVVNDGGAEVTERGICWSTNANPTLSDNHVAAGSGLGEFTALIDNLQDNTTYHVRAYATNEAGTAFGLDRVFTTASIVVLPTVITSEVSEITTNSAICGGEVTADGGADVTERGICWGTTENPTIENNHNVVSTGTGVFTVEIDGLQANTTYHVRAYATNEAGTAYGLDREFTTLSGGGSEVPEGAINGLFTINENGDKVYFSKGNLQYQASTNTWRFAENQWDLLIAPEDLVFYGSIYGGVFNLYYADVSSHYTSTYSGWIDLFGWGTSGWNNGNTYYQPWDCALDTTHYGPPGIHNLAGEFANADWGIFNAINNGGSQINFWRTLSIEEWGYLMETRNTLSGIRFVKARVNELNGIILLPDNWNETTYSLNNVNDGGSNYMSNVVLKLDWKNIFESAGAVFLPAAGYRVGTCVIQVDVYGHYWSISSYPHFSSAYGIYFDSSRVLMRDGILRMAGRSVRLVQDAR